MIRPQSDMPQRALLPLPRATDSLRCHGPANQPHEPTQVLSKLARIKSQEPFTPATIHPAKWPLRTTGANVS